jgi:undecaprenyl-diphosphatase
VGFLLDDWVEERFFNAVVVACALVVYGIAFIIIERVQGNRESSARGGHRRQDSEMQSLSFSRALAIGAFQCLAIIPGTSRSGSTILGGRILGVSRTVAAEFSFFLAIPVMFGWSLLKVLKAFVRDGLVFTTMEWGVLGVGIVVAFVVSVLAIRFLMGYIKNHSFAAFGWYRIVLGLLVLVYFAATGSLFS